MTQVEETRAAGPDLSHRLLEGEARHVAVALTQGWRWERCANAWVLRSPSRLTGVIVFDETGLIDFTPALPDWENDPAAWGALMERELSGVRRLDAKPDGPWFGQWWQREPVRGGGYVERRGPNAPRIGAAVMLAVLAKYGVEIK